MKTKIQKYETRDQLYVSAQESNEKLIWINQLRLKPARARSRMDAPVTIDSPRSSQYGPAVASFSVGVTN